MPSLCFYIISNVFLMFFFIKPKKVMETTDFFTPPALKKARVSGSFEKKPDPNATLE